MGFLYKLLESYSKSGFDDVLFDDVVVVVGDNFEFSVGIYAYDLPGLDIFGPFNFSSIAFNIF